MFGGEQISRRAVLGGSVALLALPMFEPPPVHANPACAVTAPLGAYTGVVLPSLGAGAALVRRFSGIRYGVARRFEPPQPVATAQMDQSGERGFGPVCPQQGKYAPQSEDCLFLNVWTPEGTTRALKPVMLYIHGGAYSNGSVTDPLNDGAKLASLGDVVVVTVNHRLNAFGYLYLPEHYPDSGNAGQLDLVCALQWVQRNIEAFGGDPTNVTLFGQSGGGAKIATLMAMPAAMGLFHKVITMSGQQVTASGPQHARARADAYMAALGAKSVEDLVALPAAQLVESLKTVDPIMGGPLYFGPVLDMRTLSRHPFWPDAPAQSQNVPMMLGNCISEARAFIPESGPKVQGLTWDNIAARMGPELKVDLAPDWVVAQFRARYPDYTPQQLFYAAVTAGRSWRGQVEEAEARARSGAPTWVYQLDFENAKHTDDIGLSFGTVPDATPARAAMSTTVMNAVVRFACTGDPGWPRYDLSRRATMVFDTQSRVLDDPRAWERALFARVPYIQPGS